MTLKIRVAALWQKRWVRIAAVGASVPLAALFVAAIYYYVTFARLMDAGLHGERDRVLPRVLARPLELRRGEALTDRQLIDRLNDLGYTQRPRPEHPGEFSAATGAVLLVPRGMEFKGQTVRVLFQKPLPPGRAAPRRPPPADHVERIDVGAAPSERVTLDTPVLTSLISGEREKRRKVALSIIPDRMVQAVLAIEDRRFYEHPGVDPIGVVGAMFSYLTGRRTYMLWGADVKRNFS